MSNKLGVSQTAVLRSFDLVKDKNLDEDLTKSQKFVLRRAAQWDKQGRSSKKTVGNTVDFLVDSVNLGRDVDGSRVGQLNLIENPITTTPPSQSVKPTSKVVTEKVLNTLADLNDVSVDDLESKTDKFLSFKTSVLANEKSDSLIDLSQMSKSDNIKQNTRFNLELVNKADSKISQSIREMSAAKMQARAEKANTLLH